MTLADVKGDVVILACAVSAGIHGALVPGHLAEGTGPGLGFAAATAALAGLVVWLTRRPASRPALAAAAATLAGLLGSYALATTTGLPVLHPEAEPVDGLALATKAIEAVGLLAAASLLRRPVARVHPQPKGTPA
ncbi:MAG: hypothetical protein M3321_11480 [Actinomycetota bacterium]|nr:hypothetical protein [Actinomycetota bacterium]